MSEPKIERSLEEEIACAWQYHQAADTLLIDRLQVLFVAEAFLIGAYVTLVSRWSVNLDHLYALCMLALIVLGFITSSLINLRIYFLMSGINWLKDEYMIKDPIYRGYMLAIEKKSRLNYKMRSRFFSIFLPLLFVIFWIAIFFHWCFLVFHL